MARPDTETRVPPTAGDPPTAGEMLEELLDLTVGMGVMLLPLVIFAVPGLVLLLPLALPAIPLAILGAILTPPYLLVRSLRRRRGGG